MRNTEITERKTHTKIIKISPPISSTLTSGINIPLQVPTKLFEFFMIHKLIQYVCI